MANMAKKWPNFTLIWPQKTNFAKIEHLFSLRYCLYEQAGSFLGTFIESRPSQDTVGKYFSKWHPKKVANRKIFFSDFGTNAYFELYSKKLQIGFSQKELSKKVLDSGLKLLF